VDKITRERLVGYRDGGGIDVQEVFIDGDDFSRLSIEIRETTPVQVLLKAVNWGSGSSVQMSLSPKGLIVFMKLCKKLTDPKYFGVFCDAD